MDRRFPRVRLVAVTLVVAGFFAACGARSALYFTNQAGGGGHGGGSGPGPGGGPPDSGPPDSGTGGGGGGTGGGGTCLPDGQLCSVPADCCTKLCNENFYCGPIPCKAEQFPCTFNSDCCKGHCNQEMVGKLCYDCNFPGKACDADGGLPCCMGECLNGKCSPPPCIPNGEPINPAFEATCCSQFSHKGYCAPHKCYKDQFPCVSIWDCCSFACNDGRCGKAVSCQLQGQPCPGGDNDCCSYTCNAAGTCGAAGCTANGAACKNAFECCSSKCDTGTGVCAVNNCSADALACTTDSDCCSGHCVGHVCNQLPCQPDGNFCSDPSVCCSGTCSDITGTCGGLGGQ